MKPYLRCFTKLYPLFPKVSQRFSSKKCADMWSVLCKTLVVRAITSSSMHDLKIPQAYTAKNKLVSRDIPPSPPAATGHKNGHRKWRCLGPSLISGAQWAPHTACHMHMCLVPQPRCCESTSFRKSKREAPFKPYAKGRKALGLAVLERLYKR